VNVPGIDGEPGQLPVGVGVVRAQAAVRPGAETATDERIRTATQDRIGARRARRRAAVDIMLGIG
jgi:hypothetical protein